MRIKVFYYTVVIFILSLPCTVFASETKNVNPWENILHKIADSFTGPVAYAISIIAIVGCGITMAFSDLQGGAKNFVQAACGLSIAIFAVQIVTQFLGASGAVV